MRLTRDRLYIIIILMGLVVANVAAYVVINDGISGDGTQDVADRDLEDPSDGTVDGESPEIIENYEGLEPDDEPKE